MQSFKSHTQQENPNHQTQSSTKQSIHPTVYPHYISSTNQPIIKKTPTQPINVAWYCYCYYCIIMIIVQPSKIPFIHIFYPSASKKSESHLFHSLNFQKISNHSMSIKNQPNQKLNPIIPSPISPIIFIHKYCYYQPELLTLITTIGHCSYSHSKNTGFPFFLLLLLLLSSILFIVRRKFRSQTSDNMDRWKSRGGKSQRGEEQNRKDQRRERVRRKKMQAREKVGKSPNTVFLQWFVAPEGRKVGSSKRRVRSHVARWEMKNFTPLWREAHFQVKMYKTHHARNTFGSWDVEKVHAAVARSTFPSQNVQNTPGSEHFWKLRCRKSARRCGAKHISKSKCTKHTRVGTLLEVEMSKKCTLWRNTFRSQSVQNTPGSEHFWKLWSRKSARCGEAHFEVKSVKNWPSRTTIGRSDVVLRGRRKGFCILPKVSKMWRFCRGFSYNHCTTLHSTTLHSLTLHYTSLHYTTLNYTTLH